MKHLNQVVIHNGITGKADVEDSSFYHNRFKERTVPQQHCCC